MSINIYTISIKALIMYESFCIFKKKRFRYFAELKICADENIALFTVCVFNITLNTLWLSIKYKEISCTQQRRDTNELSDMEVKMIHLITTGAPTTHLHGEKLLRIGGRVG